MNFPYKIIQIISAIQPRRERLLGVVLIERIDIKLRVAYGAVPSESVSFCFLVHKPFVVGCPLQQDQPTKALAGIRL